MPHFDLSPPRAGKQSGVRCLSTNSDTLHNKLNEVEPFLNLHQIDIAGFVETVPKNCTTEEFKQLIFNINGYSCLSNGSGRGVCLYIKDNLEVIERYTDGEKLFSPSIFCKLKTPSNELFNIGIIYRSPNASENDNMNLNKLITMMAKKSINSGEKLVILGDFNHPDINWNNETCNKPDHHISVKFLDNIHSNYLSQFVLEPTHQRALQTPTLIDLIFSNDPDLIQDINLLPPFGKSHHSVICFNIDILSPNLSVPPTYKYAFNKGDYNAMREHFSVFDWNGCLGNVDNVDQMWNIIEDELTTARDKFIPIIKISNNSNYKKHTFHAPQTLLNKIHLKRVAWKLYKQHPTLVNKKVYMKYNNQVRWLSRTAKCNKEKSIAKEAKTNPKLFFQYVNSKLKPKEKVSSLLKEDGSLTNNDLEKAELLNSFFGSVFTKEDVNNVPVFNIDKDVCIDDVVFTTTDMEKALSSLKICKSPGPDGIHPRLLKELSKELSLPLKLLFDLTMIKGKIPKKWKEAEVRPLFKKGAKSSPGNYRPVSLTSVVCKVFESFIRKAIYDHFVNNDLLSVEQYGFCKGRSCTTQLLNSLFDWFSFLDKDIPVDVVYLDFRKAFDTVPHERLLIKLKGYGVSGKILNWIKDFLSERSQFVNINDNVSSKIPVTSGVPQGSVLGPTLFIYYINDLPSVVLSLIKLFADDTKAYKSILSLKDNLDLQKSINNMVDWSKVWLLGFNGTKCKVLHVGRNNPHYKYTIEENGIIIDLKVTVCEKDIGVYIDPFLTFDDHISTIVKLTRFLSGLIIRTITFKSRDIMVPLFKTIIRPLLENAAPVWQPYMRKHINLIESVQRHYTRCIIGMSELDYEKRMRVLDLPSLEYRRMRGDMIEVYKITHGLHDPLTTKSLVTYNNSSTRSNNYKLIKPRVNTKQFQKFFTNRIINVWNNLPQVTVNANSLNCFKNYVDNNFRDYIYSTNFSK